MPALLLAQHDNRSLDKATLHALSATRELTAEIDILVAGSGCASVAEAAATLAEARAMNERAAQLREKGFYSAQAGIQTQTAADTALARLNAAKARMASAELRRSKSIVVAPDDGIISARSATVGSLTQSGQELFRLIRRSRLEWRAELNEADLLDVQVGAAVDVRQRDATLAALAALPPEWQAVDILINNAGLGRGLDKLHQGDPREWDELIDTNVKGLLYVTRALLPGMVERQRGHVINLGSVASRQSYPGGNIYCATKAAVRMLGECLKQDLLGSPVRVTTIEPGMVETEFSVTRFRGDRDRADKVYQGMTPMTAEDIAETILFCLTRPAHVNISEIVMLATDQAAAATVYRRS